MKYINKFKAFIRAHFYELVLLAFCILSLLITIRMNVFRYNNFDFGKFDLGNMTQMLWNTLHGRPLYLTDYFGTNLPRWAMSHVDPILLIFVPLFAVFQHPLTLVFSQLFLVVFASFIVFYLTRLKVKSELAALFMALAYLFYPAVGFLNAWTGFHGVTAVIPFFFAAFYMYEYMHTKDLFTRKNLVFFWVFLVLTMMGKEQLPLYIILYGLFIILYRNKEHVYLHHLRNLKVFIPSFLRQRNVKIGLSMIIVGLVWFVVAFFVLIPYYADYRVEGFQKFAAELDIDPDSVTDVSNANYFLSRYEAFGTTYAEVIFGMLSRPKLLVNVVFGGDKLENLTQTLSPMAYTSVMYPPIFLIALPDFLINYATSAGGIGTAEIVNHRISMIIPVLFISSIFSISYVSEYLAKYTKKVPYRVIVASLSLVVLFFNISKSYEYQNPVYMWLIQSVQKRLPATIFAKEDKELAYMKDIQIGDRFRLSALDNKDRECAQRVLRIIPDTASVSGPDYLGAHLSMRETYAIFPALYKSADYVIVDIFSQKILRILDVDVTLVRDVVSDVIKSSDYDLILGCGNLFVFKNVGPHVKEQLLPLQEVFAYEETTNLEIFESLTIVDYVFPESIRRGQVTDLFFAYVKREEESLSQYFLFTSFINEKTGELYQVANLPSFALNQLENWREDRYYTESLQIALPEFLDAGTYRVFIGMSNVIRTRSIYLGDVEVE